ncbi:MAG TPA: MFS transporter [Gammaproteobacteria bacterium]|nr:MFS transporter [Gammaproteobacteria bacterium]
MSSAPRSTRNAGWREYLPKSVRQYTEVAPVAALFLGISSGAPYALIVATLTTRLAQVGIDKRAITAFSLAVLVYNLKWLWAWVVDGVRLPLIGRLGQRVSWLLFVGVLTMVAIVNLALADPTASLAATAWAAILVAVAGATYDIVIDAYRIESLTPEQLGVGSGMSQYGWRIGSALAGALALVIAARSDWRIAYAACAAFALPAMLTGLILGEPSRHREPARRAGLRAVVETVVAPLVEFFWRKGAVLVLAFVLFHKIGDTLANLTFRLLFNALDYSNDEIAVFDVGFGFWAYLAGIFVCGLLYERLGMKRAVFLSLLLMAVTNLSFAGLAVAGHSDAALAAAIGFENLASGFGGVAVVAYFSALCDLRYTASQYALISAAASVLGRLLTGATAGALIERLGYFNFYVLTTVAAVPGIVLFWLIMRRDELDAGALAGERSTQISRS